MILGIDPGKSGGFAILKYGTPSLICTFAKMTEKDMVEELREVKEDITFAFLEQVHSMPGQGVKSMFTFGQNYGFWQGVLMSFNIPYDLVTPLSWQTALGCRTKGDKNVTKRKAQRLFPEIKVTHANADALLIAYYGQGRR